MPAASFALASTVKFDDTVNGAVYVSHETPSFTLYSFTVVSPEYVTVTVTFEFVQAVGLAVIVGITGAVLSTLNAFDFVTTLFPALSDPFIHK
ncbi:hypothetical protein D3C81_1573960 [compost metagenome]